MTTKNLFQATPTNGEITGFIFTDLEAYRAEFDHRHALFGTEEYKLQAIAGNQIDLDLFTGLPISQANLPEWFNEIQHLTTEEKVGLWFLVACCGCALDLGLDILRDGLTIFHGTKKDWVGAWHEQASFAHGQHRSFESAGSVLEFRFGGETWCGTAMAS